MAMMVRNFNQDGMPVIEERGAAYAGFLLDVAAASARAARAGLRQEERHVKRATIALYQQVSSRESQGLIGKLKGFLGI